MFILLFIYLFYLYFPGYVALWDSKTPHRPAGERVSWCLETSLLRLPPQDGSSSLTLLSLFLSVIFCPTSFWRQWAAFLGAWCSPPRSEVVLWYLLSVQMFFRWICGGESGLPVLFLCYLRTAFGVCFCRSFSSLVFPDYISPINICSKAGLVVLNSLNFCLSVKLFISPSILNEILVG